MSWQRVDLGPAGLRYLIQQLESGDQLGRALARLDLAAGETWTVVAVPDAPGSALRPASVEMVFEAAILPAMATGHPQFLLSEDHPVPRTELSRQASHGPKPNSLETRFVDPGLCEVFIPDLGPIFDVLLPVRALWSPAGPEALRELIHSSRHYPLVVSLTAGELPQPSILTVAELESLVASTSVILTDGWDDTGLVVWSRLPSRSSMELPTG